MRWWWESLRASISTTTDYLKEKNDEKTTFDNMIANRKYIYKEAVEINIALMSTSFFRRLP